MLPRSTPPHTECPYCMMLRSALRNAFIGMSVSAMILIALASAHQSLVWF